MNVLTVKNHWYMINIYGLRSIVKDLEPLTPLWGGAIYIEPDFCTTEFLKSAQSTSGIVRNLLPTLAFLNHDKMATFMYINI